jgi:hypothetical protein
VAGSGAFAGVGSVLIGWKKHAPLQQRLVVYCMIVVPIPPGGLSTSLRTLSQHERKGFEVALYMTPLFCHQ